MPHTKSRHGYALTATEARTFRASSDRCWICNTKAPVEGQSLAVDHDHETGIIRGLLCARCNRALGLFRDDTTIVQRAVDYLEHARDGYSDMCPVCRENGDYNSVPPAELVKKDENHVVGGYRCPTCGHRWRCTWAVQLVCMAPA